MADNETAGETASNAQEMVGIEDASMEDLDAFLANNTGDDEGETEEVDADEPEDTSDESQETEPTGEPEADANSQETKGDARIKALEEQLAKLNQKASTEKQQRETYIQRLKFQLGEERKAKIALRDSLRQGLREKFDEDPIEALQQQRKLEKVEESLEQIDQGEQQVDFAARNQEIFERYIDPSEVSLDDMADTLARDGIDPRLIEQFRSHPFLAADGQTLVHLARRAKAEKLAAFAVYQYQKLKEENEQLKKKPAQTLDKVSQALKTPPKMTGGAGTQSRGFSDADISKMTNAELDSLYKSLIKR